MAALLRCLLVLSMVVVCQCEERPPQMWRYFDFMPEGVINPTAIEVRSTLQGAVKVVEAAQFGISVNITAATHFDLTRVHVTYDGVDNVAVLQLSSANGEPQDPGELTKIPVAVATALAGISGFVTLMYLLGRWCVKEDHSPEGKSTKENIIGGATSTPGGSAYLADSDPCLDKEEGDGTLVSNDASKLLSKKRKKPQLKKQSEVSSSEDVSSIDDTWNKKKIPWNIAPGMKRNVSSRSSDVSGRDHSMANSTEYYSQSRVLQPFGHHSGAPPMRLLGSATTATGVSTTGGDVIDDMEWDPYQVDSSSLKDTSEKDGNSNLRNTAEGAGNSLGRALGGDRQEVDGAAAGLSPADLLVTAQPGSWHLEAPSEYSTEGLAPERGFAVSDIPAPEDTLGRGPLVPTAHSPESPPDDGYDTAAPLMCNGTGSDSSQGLNPPPPLYPPPPPPTEKGTERGVALQNGGGGKRPNALTHGHMIALTVLGVLCLSSGAYAIASSMNHHIADITIFLPVNYVKVVRVFTNSSGKITFNTDNAPKYTPAYIVETHSEVLLDVSKAVGCGKLQCKHTCDLSRGRCVCERGFSISEAVNCKDKSECIYLPCQEANEVCEDLLGSYRCTCQPGHQRQTDGTCVKCSSTTCPEGQYEKVGCPFRVCAECNTRCPQGEYLINSCSPISDIKCESCRPPCRPNEYEFVPCTDVTDRQCRPRQIIGRATGSKNIILDELNTPSHHLGPDYSVRTKHYLQKNGATPITETFTRSSEITINVTLKSVNLYPQFVAVDHTEGNDNSAFSGNESILADFCPSPIPERYEVTSYYHGDVTAEDPCEDIGSVEQDCDPEDDNGMGTCDERCEIDPRVPCETFRREGNVAFIDPSQSTVFCARPGKFADVFSLDDYLSQQTHVHAPRTGECEERQEGCKRCIQSCAREITEATTGNCTIRGDEYDNGLSPRLRYCQGCCERKTCIEECKAFSERQCRPKRCWKGNVAEFGLLPVFSFAKRRFVCHVELEEGAPMIDLEYTIMYKGEIVKTFSLNMKQSKETVLGKIYSDGFLTVHYTAGLESIPTLVKGMLGDGPVGTFELEAGVPNTVGLPVHKGASASDKITVIPKEPFGINTMWWSRQTCNSELADKIREVNGTDSMFVRDGSLEVIKEDDHGYSIWTQGDQPYIFFDIPTNASLVEKVFQPAYIDPRQLSGVILSQPDLWVVKVDGKVNKCDSHFIARLWEKEDAFPLQATEVGVRCYGDGSTPGDTSFQLVFNVPGEFTSRTDRNFSVELETASQKVIVPINSANPPVYIAPTTGKPPNPGYIAKLDLVESPLSVMGPYLVLIAISTLLFGLLWAVSKVIPAHRGKVLADGKVRSGGVLLYVIYRVLHATITSFSFIILIWYSMNSIDVAIVQQYPSTLDTVIAIQQHDLQHLVEHALAEVKRHNSQHLEMRRLCYKNILSLQDRSRKMLSNASAYLHAELEMTQDRSGSVRQALDSVARLSEALEQYKDRYDKHALGASSRLLTAIERTPEEVERGAWLEGARIIHQKVSQVRRERASVTKEFGDWIGLEETLSGLTSDFTMKDMPSLTVDTAKPPPVPEPKPFVPLALEDVIMPTNTFYFDPQVPRPAPKKPNQSYSELSLSVSLSLVTTVVLFIGVDLLIFLHRLVSLVDRAGLILHGRIVVKVYNSVFTDSCSSSKLVSRSVKKKSSNCSSHFSRLMTKTDFVPKLVGVTLVFVVTYVTLHVNNKYLNVEELNKLGLTSTLMGPWERMSHISRSSIEQSMRHINVEEIPRFERLYNTYLGQIDRLNNLYKNVTERTWQAHCPKSAQLEPTGACSPFPWERFTFPVAMGDYDCTLTLVQYNGEGYPSVVGEEDVDKLVEPYVNSLKAIVVRSAYIALTLVTVLLLADMFETCLWDFLTRLAVVPGEWNVSIDEKKERELTRSKSRASTTDGRPRPSGVNPGEHSPLVEEEEEEETDQRGEDGENRDVTMSRFGDSEHVSLR